jgi:hypothetical protein
MSAIGSVIVMRGLWPFFERYLARDVRDLLDSRYQLDFEIPGSSPRCAISRKHTRQSPNFL